MKVLALDIGGTKIASAIVDENMRTAEVQTSPTAVHEGPASVLRQIKELSRTVMDRHDGIRAVTLSSAGPLDLKTGAWLSPTNFITHGKPWGRVDIVAPLEAALGIPVFVENDAACAVLGQHWIEEKKHADMAVITLGTGVGIGVLVDNELVRKGGVDHPETSHIPLMVGDLAAPCECGLYGCIEAYLASTHFAKRHSELQKTWLKTENIAAASRAGEKWAVQAFNVYAEQLGYTFMTLKTLFQPQMIVISGGLAAISDLYFPAAVAHFEKLRESQPSPSPAIQFKVSRHTFELSLFGAAAKAFRGLETRRVV